MEVLTAASAVSPAAVAPGPFLAITGRGMHGPARTARADPARLAASVGAGRTPVRSGLLLGACEAGCFLHLLPQGGAGPRETTPLLLRVLRAKSHCSPLTQGTETEVRLPAPPPQDTES